MSHPKQVIWEVLLVQKSSINDCQSPATWCCSSDAQRRLSLLHCSGQLGVSQPCCQPHRGLRRK